jgi:MAF protein
MWKSGWAPRNAPQHEGSFVLAADTVVALGRRILPKPADAAAARRSLALLSGRRHRVLGAVVLVGPDGARARRLVTTAVRFKRLAESEIEAYLDSGEWQDKAGGYAIQGRAAAFVPAINGSYSNVVGLPLAETAALLHGLGRPAACRNGGTAARAGLPVVKLLVSAQPGELRAAWIDGGRLADLLIQRDDHPSRLGEIHLGRVAAVDHGLGAAFVDLGLESPGFLPLAEAPGERLTEGAAVTVRVDRSAAGSGATCPRRQAALSLDGRQRPAAAHAD